MRAWRSTYCPVTSVDVVVTDVAWPSCCTWDNIVPKEGCGTRRMTVPDDEVPGTPAPIWACGLATNPPSRAARPVSLASTDSSFPSPIVRLTDPFASTLGDWPTDPGGSGGTEVGPAAPLPEAFGGCAVPAVPPIPELPAIVPVPVPAIDGAGAADPGEAD